MDLTAAFKQTDIGPLPSDWDVVPLGQLVRITSGESPSRFVFQTSGTPYYKVEQLSATNKYLSRSSTPYHFDGNTTVPARSVVFAKRGAAIALNKVRILTDASFMDTNLMALTPGDRLDAEYLYYALAHIGLWRFADTTSVPQINNKHINPLQFPLPTLAEQESIARALGDVDTLLERLDQLIVKKRDLRLATMQQLLSAEVRLPGFTEDWRQFEFGELAEIRNSKAVPRSLPTDVPCVELDSIESGTGRLIGSTSDRGTSSKYIFHESDVLFGRLRAYLRKYWLATFSGICSTEIWPLRPRDQRMVPGFLHLVVQTNAFVDAAGISYGTHMPRSDWDVVRKFPVRLPPREEQQAIASVVADMDAELDLLEARVKKTSFLRLAMMHELLTGKTRLHTTGGSNG